MNNKFLRFFQIAKNTLVLKKDDAARFRIHNGLKMAMIPLFTLLMTVVFFSILLQMDLIFFEANGFSGAKFFKETYYDYIFTKLIWVIPSILIFFVIVFMMGIYISELLLRPFKVIGDYCEKSLDEKEVSYDPDFFSDLKLLTSFSEWFFNLMENAKISGELRPQKIPNKFTKIHRPVFELSFFIQYSLFILITSICEVIVIKLIALDLHNQITKLSYDVLEVKPEVLYFLKHQGYLFENTLYVVLIFHILAYCGLALHLYAKVSVPAFAFFATMRSYAKGSRECRVHLIGYYFIRPYSRKFNKYLDKITDNLKK